MISHLTVNYNIQGILKKNLDKPYLEKKYI